MSIIAVVLAGSALAAVWHLRASVAQSLQRLRAGGETGLGRISQEEAPLQATTTVEAQAPSRGQAARERFARESSIKVTAEDVAGARNLEQAARERLARESSLQRSAVEPPSLGGIEIKPGALPALTALLLQGLSQPGAEEGAPAVLAAVEAELTTLGILASRAVKSGEDCPMPPELGRFLLLLATRISIGIGLLGEPEQSEPPGGAGGPSELH